MTIKRFTHARRLILGLVATAGTLVMAVCGEPAGPAPDADTTPPAEATPAEAPAEQVLEVEQLADNLFLLTGGGGNTAVFIQTDGVTVVDTKLPGWGPTLIETVQGLTSKPVTTIINTHTHFDHVGGNVDFPATIEVIAQENTLANMKRGVPPKGLEERAGPDVFQANGGRNMATRTFADELSVGEGADRIDLYYFGRGHTNGDAWVVFPALRTAHSGDVFARKDLVFLDGNNGASGVEIPETLTRAADALGSEVDAIITGHGPVMTIADLREFAQFNRDFLAFVRAGKAAGQSVEAIATSWQTPPGYEGYPQVPSAASDMTRIQGNVQVIYDELPD